VRNDLKADPRMVDLRGLNPNFFSFGALNLELWPEDDELLDLLVEVCGENNLQAANIWQSFKKRAREIGDQAPNQSTSVSSEVADFRQRLDEDERHCKLLHRTHSGRD
jgi:hypothetical protein